MIANRGEHEIIIALNAHFSEATDALYTELSRLLPPENIVTWHIPGTVRYSDTASASRREVAQKSREAFLASLKPDMVLIMSLFEGFSDDTVTSISVLNHTPTAFILYDLIPLIHAGHYLENTDLKAWYLGKIEALRQADLLLSISQSAKQEAHDYLNIPEERVVNISTAADALFRTQEINKQRETEIKKRYGIWGDFLMYTGGIDHRKNIEGLIRAYALLPLRLRDNFQLAIVCSITDLQKEHLSQLARSNGLRDDEVIFTGYISDDDLLALYNLCHTFIFPSWHEGFGLPALEAMLCGRVVIGSNLSSLPEVIGLDEALFDPNNDQSIAAKMEQALTDESFRKRLKEHNLEQVKKFSWDTSAQAALAAIEKKVAYLAVSTAQNRDDEKDSDIFSQLLLSISHTVQNWSEDELWRLSQTLAQDFPPKRETEQILLDVSALIGQDGSDKYRKRALEMVRRLLKSPLEGYRVEPVYRVKNTATYCYARQFTADILGISAQFPDNEKIDAYRGDIFVGIDIGRYISADMADTIRQMRYRGITTAFALYTAPNKNYTEHYLSWLELIASCDILFTRSKAQSDTIQSELARENIRTLPLFETIEIQEHKASAVLMRLYRAIRFAPLDEQITWRIEGPFDSSYSLALINRETALALDALGHDISLHSTEGGGDFEPSKPFLAAHPRIAELYGKSIGQTEQQIDVCSRILYPPRVADMQAPVNLLHHYAWEESVFPSEWIKDFNRYLQGMTVLSKHVQKIMIDNGLRIPLAVSGCGVDHWERITPDQNFKLDDTHQFRFLHISSCFPRKGADILLRAYGKSFDAKDDVVLIIKTFPNPHNEIHKWLEEARALHSNFPAVMIIEEDLSEPQLKALYLQCHALVAPSRAEGFGLPLAEAMLSGLPVITTGWGGQVDFCDHETVWLVDYTFTAAKTHFELSDSVWAEPSEPHLAEVMREVYLLPTDQRQQRSSLGRELLLSNFRWEHAAQRLVDAARLIAVRDHLSEPKIGWITTWNTRCGIAAYSAHLIGKMDQNVAILAAHTEVATASDTPNVHRCWRAADDEQLTELDETIERLGLDTIVLQFNYGFFNFYHLYNFLGKQHQRGRTVVVMMHSTTDPGHILFKYLEILLPAFEYLDRILVHSVSDLNHLKAYGLVENVTLFPHGIPDWHRESAAANQTFVLASYGFFLPHKGLLELIDTMHILVKKGFNVSLKMVNAEYPVAVSKELIKEAAKMIEATGLTEYIELIPDFLPDEASLTHLSSADLILFPYQETGESSSAAVRYGLASGSPVAVTPLKIFEDVDQAVYKLSGFTPSEMAESIIQIITEIQDDSITAQQQHSSAAKWCETHRYSKLGERLENMLCALANQKKS